MRNAFSLGKASLSHVQRLSKAFDSEDNMSMLKIGTVEFANVIKRFSKRGCIFLAMLFHMLWLIAVQHRQLRPLAAKMVDNRNMLVDKVEITDQLNGDIDTMERPMLVAMDSTKRQFTVSPTRVTKYDAITPTDDLSLAQAVDRERPPAEEFSLSLPGAPQCSPLSPLELSFSLVTQCNEEQIPLISAYCRRWGGPISLAVYSERPANEILAQARSLNCTSERLQVNTLSPHGFPKEFYPINSLRNLAIQHARTTHFLYMDIEFVPSANIESTFRSKTLREALAADHKLAIVVPAFEIDDYEHNRSKTGADAPNTKKELMRLHSKADTWVYKHVGDDLSDFELWKQQSSGSLVDLPCNKSITSEPFLVVRNCLDTPPYQEKLSNTRYTRASFMMQLQARGYRFSQTGYVFCSRMAHIKGVRERSMVGQDHQTHSAPLMAFKSWLCSKYVDLKQGASHCRQTGSNETVLRIEGSRSGPNKMMTSEFLPKSELLAECREVKPHEITFSMVTQCSEDRLWMMEHQCQRWAMNNTMPHISLVVFTNETLFNIKERLLNYGCPVDEGMVVQTYPKIFPDHDYPVNEIRNLAFAAATTTHAIMIDIDFWVSSDLFSSLNTEAVREILSVSDHNAVVVPAFQLQPHCKRGKRGCSVDHKPLMPFTRDQRMLSRYKKGDITEFNAKENVDGHGSTRYDLWIHQSAEEVLRIPCIASSHYEPYLVVRLCRDLPPFQPVFTGYGLNKISWIMHLHRAGWKLYQLGQAFLIHYPHAFSPAKMVWRQVPGMNQRKSGEAAEYENSIRILNENRFKMFKNWLSKAVPNQTIIPSCNQEQ